MANITEYINNIENAVYGAEVRDSIVDAIKECYDNASVEHDNANMEVTLARGAYNTLNSRLNDNDVALKNLDNNKATRQEVASQINSLDIKTSTLASGSPKATFSTLALLQSDVNANTTEGKKCIYVVTADGNWYYWNGSAWTSGGTYQSSGIADKSITQDKLSFETVVGIPSKNLFDISIGTLGYCANYSNGNLEPQAGQMASGFIRYTPSAKYFRNGGYNGHCAFYNNAKVFVSGVLTTGLITAPATEGYMRVSFANYLNDFSACQLELGTSATPFVPYGNTINPNTLPKASISKEKLGTDVTSLYEKVIPVPHHKKDLSEYAPIFYKKWKKREEDLVVLVVGDSISTSMGHQSERTDAMNRPPLMTEMAYATYIEEQLRWEGQTYFRHDTGIFTEVSPTTAITKEYDTAWDWIALGTLNCRPASTRVLAGLNASVSYWIPIKNVRCDFIYRTDYLNAANAVVTINKGNGYVTVYDEATDTWIEANGYSYIAKENDVVIAATKGNLRKSIYQKRLKMKTTLALNDGTIRVTITNNGDGRLTYWGIQCSKHTSVIDFISVSRGSHSILNLNDFEAWDIDYWKPNLILWQIPFINSMSSICNSSWVSTTDLPTPFNFAKFFKDKALVYTSKSYTPELISYPMWIYYNANAINNSNVWQFGIDKNGNQVSFPMYLNYFTSLFKENNLNLIPLFDYYLEYAMSLSKYKGTSIREGILVGSGITGDTWTMDGTHFNDKGSSVTNDIIRPFFNC